MARLAREARAPRVLVVSSQAAPSSVRRARRAGAERTLGHTNQEIAGRVFTSVRTVETHRAHIMLKLDLETRARLVMFALANGVIGP